MGLAHSPKITTNGLVFYYDMGNPQKSWKGAPTTNAIQTNLNLYDKDNGCTVTQLSETFEGNPIYRVVFPAGTLPRIRTTFAYTTGQQYTGSIYYKVIAQGSHTPQLIFRENGFGTTYTSTSLTSTSWQRANITHTFSSSGTSMFLLYQSNSAATTPTTIDFSMPQTELRSFATPYVNGTRSNTQAIVDLTGRNTITATSPTYNSNGTFSFSGGTERLDISNTIGPIANNFSISAWVNSTDITATQNIVSMNGPYFMRISGSKVRFNVLAGGAWLFQNGTTTLSSNTWYNFCMVYNYDSSLWIGYINGVQEFSVAKTGTVSNTSFFGYVGYTPQGGEQSNFLGQIAAVQYYNRALSATEVQQNFNALRGRYGV